jgi:hypothetical protein
MLADGRLHGQQQQHVEQMVLHHVADAADLIIELASPLHAEILGHGDLHALDIVAVPDRLQESIGEPEIKQVLDRFLAEIVVDAEDGFLIEDQVQHPVQPPRRLEVPPEGLFHHQACALSAAGLFKPLYDRFKHGRRDGKVMERMVEAGQLLLQLVESGLISIVAAYVVQKSGQFRECLFIDLPHSGLDAVMGTLPQLLHRPVVVSDPDDRFVEAAMPDHRVKRRENLLVGEIACCAEQDQHVGSGFVHGGSLRLPAFSRNDRQRPNAWPTGACRQRATVLAK